MTVPRTILFREEHSPRVLVERVAQHFRARHLAARRVPARPCPGAGDGALRVPLPCRGARASRWTACIRARRWRASAPPPASTSIVPRGRRRDAGRRPRGIGAAARPGLRRDVADLPGILRARVRKEGSPHDGRLPRAEGKGLARSAGALAGLKVIDLTRVLGGPYCTMVLSDHGAEVMKLEPPQGDEVRDWGPPFDEHGDASYFLGVNRNKRSVGLDLSKPAGREVLLRLLEGADVLVENFKPGSMEKWGLGYEQVLQERFPRLIHCRVSGFGADGPLGGFPGYDAVLQAMVGLMSINGTETAGRRGSAIRSSTSPPACSAAIAILMALQERERSGMGQYLRHDPARLRHGAPAPARRELLPERQAAARRPATRTRTSRPIPNSARGPARSSSPPATTRPSANSATSSACPRWRRTRASPPTARAWSTATR